jgi:hypothetical protein
LQNSSDESFTQPLRRECLDEVIFSYLGEAKGADRAMGEYNYRRLRRPLFPDVGEADRGELAVHINREPTL